MIGENFTIYKDDLFFKVRNTHPTLSTEVNLFGGHIGLEPNPATPAPTGFLYSNVSGNTTYTDMAYSNGKFYVADYISSPTGGILVVDSESGASLPTIPNTGVPFVLTSNEGSMASDDNKKLLLTISSNSGGNTPELNIYSTITDSLVGSVDLSSYPNCYGGAIDTEEGVFYTYDASNKVIVKIDYINESVVSTSTAFAVNLNYPIYNNGSIYILNFATQEVLRIDSDTLSTLATYSIGELPTFIKVDNKYGNVYIQSVSKITCLSSSLSYLGEMSNSGGSAGVSRVTFNTFDDYVYLGDSTNGVSIRGLDDFSLVKGYTNSIGELTLSSLRSIEFNNVSRRLYISGSDSFTAPVFAITNPELSVLESSFFDTNTNGSYHWSFDNDLGRYIISGSGAGQGQSILQGGWRASINGSSDLSTLINQISVQPILTSCVKMDISPLDQFYNNFNYTGQGVAGKYNTQQIDPMIYRTVANTNGVIAIKDIKMTFDGTNYLNFTMSPESRVDTRFVYKTVKPTLSALGSQFSKG